MALNARAPERHNQGRERESDPRDLGFCPGERVRTKKKPGMQGLERGSGSSSKRRRRRTSNTNSRSGGTGVKRR